MKLTLVLLILVAPVFAEAADKSPRKSLGKSLESAQEHLRAGQFSKARIAAQAVSERDAAYARAQYLVGEISLLLGEDKAAIVAYRKSLKAKPGSGPILTGLGRALVADEEFEEAVTVLKKAVAKNPKSGRAYCFLGIARLNETYGKKGARDIAKGVKLAPDDSVVVRAATLYWLDEEQPKLAMKVAEAFRRNHKKHPMGHFLLALTHERAGEYDKAIAAYQKSIACDEKFIDAHKNLAILCIAQNPMYKNKKRTDLAMKHFTAYRTLGGKDAGVIQIHETLKKFMPQILKMK